MRTTLDLDDDLLSAARELARQQRATLGQAISKLARQTLESKATQKIRNGVPLFMPKAGTSKTNLRIVNRLLDDE